ncbi:MAG: hypothetical protein ACI4QA_03625 [Candidatus Spyradosoma sp.]
MKHFFSAILAFSLACVPAGAAEDALWTTTFTNKTSLATALADGVDLEVAFVSCKDAATGGSDVAQLSSGSIAGTTTLFTPDTNVQTNSTTKGWTANFTVKNNGAGTVSVSRISLVLVAFNSSGDAQVGTRNLKLTVAFDGVKFTQDDLAVTNFTADGQTVEAALPYLVELEPGKTYSLAITAGTPTTTQGGCFFGLRAFSGILPAPKVWEAWTLPQGFVAKSLPAGTTSYFSATVQKPALTEAAASFYANDETGEITILADEDVDFSELLESGRAYLLEIVTEKGDAVFLLNRDFWRGESGDSWRAEGNTLTVADSDAVRLLAQTPGTAFRLREAWTTDEIFGASFAAGELKVGTSLSGDAVYPNIGGGATIKLFYKNSSGWATTGRWGANASFGDIPLHPHEPVRVVRKSGADLVLAVAGATLNGDALVKMDSARELLCTGDAFPQTFGNSGAGAMSFLTSAKIFSGGAWLEAENADELGEAVLVERSSEDPDEIFKTFKIFTR